MYSMYSVPYIYIYMYIYSSTEERHRSVRKHWSSYYHFIGLKCNYYALYCVLFIKNPIRGNFHTLHCHIL